MTTPAIETRGGKPAPLADLTPTFERQPASCPKCGSDSFGIRFAPPPAVLKSEALRQRLEAERPFVPQTCETCQANARAAAVREREAAAIALAVEQLSVPALYADVSIDTFAVDDDPEGRLLAAATFARWYLGAWPDVPPIAVFAGGCGTGKGHLAWSIVKELAATRAVRGKVAVLSDIIRDVREAWNTHEGPTEAQRLAKYRAAGILVIDEVSRHAFFGQPQQHLYDLIAWREVRLLPTILTSNELADDLAQVLGPAISSRAIGAGGFINFGTRDWRIANQRRRIA